jgi:hypothetical protein
MAKDNRAWCEVRTNLSPFVEIRLELGAIRGHSFSVQWNAAAAEDGRRFEVIG